MQLVNGNIAPSQNDENYSSQLIISRYRNLGKERFQGFINYDVNPIDFIKECTVNYALNLPPEIGEFIISTENIPLVWLSDLPVFSAINDFLRSAGIAKGDISGSILEIKKFFSKWLMTKSDKERQFYYTSALNLIEKDVFKFNYQKYVYKALLISFDKHISNIDAAISSMILSIETISELELEENLKNEIEYILYLTLGFVYLKGGMYNEATQAFENVSSVRPYGATGLLYKGLTAKLQGDSDKAIESLTTLLNLDMQRISYALKLNKIEAYQFFLKNSYVYQLFKENRFANSYNEIESLLDSFYVTEENIMFRISLMTSELEELRLKVYYTDDIKKQLEFITKFVDKFRNSKSQIVLMSATLVKEKFINVTNLILEAIRASKLADMSKKLHVYDHQLKDATHSMKILRESGGRRREKLNEQLEENIEILQQEYKEKMEYAQQLIKNLDNSNKFDSGKAFSTGMFYNFVIAIFIFVIGGLGTAMMSGSSGFNMNQFMINGIKWGGIAFVLGIFAAIFSAVNTITEKSNEKARLNRFMDSIKQEQTGMTSRFKEDNSERMKMFDESYNAELHKEETRLEKLRKEKEGKYQVFTSRVENEMSEFREQMNKIINV